jgi:hypothetical protein
LEIVIASDVFMMDTLTKIAEDSIIENNPQFLRSDPVGILQAIHNHNSPSNFSNLQEFCFDAICFEPQLLIRSSKFTQISASLLETILKRDDLNLEEIEIWEYLIIWGLAQLARNNPVAATSSRKEVRQEELKKILSKFIPLIRFFEISSDDYIFKVKPYEELLSKELRDDILKFHMANEYVPTLRCFPPRHSNSGIVNSNIIDQNHIALFASWIDRKEGDSKYIKATPYEFNLLYKDSRDKSNSRKVIFRNIFHEKCDNKGATLTVARIKGSNQIVGGYNPLDWNGHDYKNTSDSFIFYFNDCYDLNTGKIGRVTDPKHAIQCRSNWGPIFGMNVNARSEKRFSKTGAVNGGSLIIKQNGKWRSSNNSYPDIGIPNQFKTYDYEVFQVIKRTTKV